MISATTFILYFNSVKINHNYLHPIFINLQAKFHNNNNCAVYNYNYYNLFHPFIIIYVNLLVNVYSIFY